MFPVGGDAVADGTLFGRNEARALHEELAALRAWGPSVVIALTDPSELDRPGLLGLPDLVRSERPTWVLLPIPRFEGSDREFEARWLYARHLAHAALRREARVAVYGPAAARRVCAVAARLLAELRSDAVPAITAVERARAERPMSTDAVRWVRDAANRVPDRRLADRVLGGLLGGAAGDALGAPLEFMRLRQIRHRFGPHGPLQPVLRTGASGAASYLVSDDTQLALFTAEGIARAFEGGAPPGVDRLVATIRRAYRDWLTTQRAAPGEAAAGVPDRIDWLVGAAGDVPHTPLSDFRLSAALGARRAPDEGSLEVLASGELGRLGDPVNDAASAVAVVRAAPLGLVAAWPPAVVFELATRTAALTHGDAATVLSAGVLAATIRELVHGRSPLDAIDRSLALLAGWRGAHPLDWLVRRACVLAAGPRADPAAALEELGDGLDGGSALAIGIYALLAGHDFVETVRIAANHDGNSASTAAIAGQLAGTALGAGAVPGAWVQSLDVCVPLLHQARQLLELGRSLGP